MAKILKAFDNFWKITENGSDFKTEIIGGLTTFMAMAYILVVNPTITCAMLEGAIHKESIYIGTAFGALVGTLMMALYAKLPFAQAPGMGLNAYFAYNVVGAKMGGYNYTYANALFIVLISGVIFLLLTIFGIREKIVDSVPACVKDSITAGIGLFIAFVGLQNSDVIRDGATLVGFAPLNAVDCPFEDIWPTLVVLLNFLIICMLCYHKVRGGLLWGILVGTLIHYIVGLAGGYIDPKDDKQMQKLYEYTCSAPWNCQTVDDYFGARTYVWHCRDTVKITDPGTALKDWGKESAFMVFRKGWEHLFQSSRWFKDLLNIIAMVLSFAMVDMFDTIGTLLGTAKRAKLLNAEGKLDNMGQALLCDSIGTLAGACCGVSTVTTFIESSAGVNEGAKTGFASLITALCFFIAIFLSPLAQIIPSTATTPALVYVGVLMMSSITSIDFNDVSVAAPAFMVIAFMPFSYNISIGIALGLLLHTFMKAISAAIYAILAACHKSPPVENDVSEEIKEEDAEMDQLSEHENSSNEENYQDHEVDPEERRQANASRPTTYKEMAMNELKQISITTVVVDVFFLVYFFCARK